MYLFVMLLFLNQNALDRSAKHLISNLTSHTNHRWFIAMKANAQMEQDSFTEPCCTPKSICFSSDGGQKKEICSVHKQGEKHPRATKWKQDTIIQHFATWHYAEQAMKMPYTHSHKTFAFVNTNLAYLLYSNNFPCFAVKT